MELINNFNIYELSQTIGWTLIHSVWQATAIGGLIWLLFQFISKDNARIRYALSSFGLLLLFVTSAITFYRYLPSNTNTAFADFTVQLGNLENLPQKTYYDRLWIELQMHLKNIFPYLVQIWVIGMLFLSINLILKYIYSLKLKNHLSYPLRSEYNTITESLMVKFNLKQTILFKESGLLEIPSVIGYFKPIVLIPVSMLSGIPKNQLEIIIAHELAHIRRHDYLLQFIQEIFELIFFYHPVVWWLSSVVNTEREHICDDLAVKVCGESLTLIKALNNMEAIRKKQYEMVLSFSGKKGKVLNRIKRILRPKNSNTPRKERFVLSGVFTLLFAGLFLISNFAISGNLNSQKALFSKISILENTTHSTNQSVQNEEVLFQASPAKSDPKKKKKKKEDKTKTISENKNPDEVNEVFEVAEIDEVAEIFEITEVEKIEIPTMPSFPSAPDAPINSTNHQKFNFPKDSVIITSIDSSKQPLFILDGKEITRSQMDLSPNEIASISVIKDDSAIKLYGKKAKNGVILITSKPNAKQEVELKFGSTKNPPLFFIDGKKTSPNEADKIDSEHIESINVIKGENATNKYGEDAKNGAVEITTKTLKTSDKSSTKLKFGSTKNPPIFIINGEKTSPNEADKIDSENIESINVIKGENATNKYGEDAKNGAVEITTKTLKTSDKSSTKLKFGSTKNPPIFIINGEKTSPNEADKIDSENIESINVIKGENATNKYGEDAKNGAVEITTKTLKTSDKSSTKLKFGSTKNPPIFIINGEKISEEKAKKIDPNSIDYITILRDENATKQYGEEAKNGAVVIRLNQ
ncbi:hypothetical protein BZG02_16650 [Labilibaculum filiforme]|uniref:Peptidase M56 domain-containing protein n=1 Tax=Labilibaculum filiforme TaxID=1940526 RepID=A0A2N3HT80_9BACT|nr:M56 family metallopeptidase [Labilibaculum filiforme]PKQ61262.1 hypothetical protein BZG02_16650 [Labilibaculum filiforme]